MPRSTRNKIRFQVGKSVDCIDRAIEHLAKTDVTANGQSDIISKEMPKLVVLLESVKGVLKQFRDTL